MARFLFLTWDGGGSAVPYQALVERLCNRGHQVVVWGHEAARGRFEPHGGRFVTYPAAAPYDSTARFGATEAEHAQWVFRHVMASDAIGDDAALALAEERPDAVLVDEWLLMAHCVVQASRTPAASLAHSPAAGERPRAAREAVLGFALPDVNRRRAELGLAPVGSILEVIEATGPLLAATAPAFDPPAEGSRAIQVGPIRPSATAVPLDGTDRRVVLVGLSTGWMHQVDLLQRIADSVDALDVEAWITLGPSIATDELRCPPNVRLFRDLPHDQVLPMTKLLITHAGHGTLMAGLSHGVPMICIPLGRDQPANAAQAAKLGAALVLDASASVEEIRVAVERGLSDGAMAARSREIAAAITAQTRLDVATSVLERLLK